MELRQLRYFVRIVELGSIGAAARDLQLVPSALSQQISRLESELSTRLLQRSTTGIQATDAGVAFYRQAQLALRHTDDAVRAAQQARLSGHVSLGMSPSESAVLALPYLKAMRERYPDVRLRLVESLSTNLAAMLDSRQLDLAILFDSRAARRPGAIPLVEERLFLIGLTSMPELQGLRGSRVEIRQLSNVPLVLGSQGIRGAVDAAFDQAGCKPRIVLEIDGMMVLLDAVRAGIGATIQPGASTLRLPLDVVARIEIADPGASRLNMLVSLNEEELSPAVLAARIVLRDITRELVLTGQWPGASLHKT